MRRVRVFLRGRGERETVTNKHYPVSFPLHSRINNIMSGEPECPVEGCWWERPDVARRVLSCLLRNRDVLTSDLVCMEWERLQVELPEPITLCAVDMRNPAVTAWINRNLGRIRHLVLRSDEAATGMLPRLKSRATGLHSLEVAQCSAMQQLPAGLGGLPHLTALVFNSCLSMRSLPSDLSALTGLKYLSVGGSPNSLSEVPDSIAALTCLQHLKLHGCYLLQNIPDAVGALTALTCLDIDMDCDSPGLVANLQLPTSRMTALSSSISRLTGLQHLTVRGANLLPELPDVFGALEKLQELRLIGINAMQHLPDSLGHLPALTCLVVYGADALEAMPSTIGGLSSLRHMTLSYCHRLTSIPEDIASLSSLEHLVLGCHGLMDSLPGTLGNLSALTHLSLETASLTSIPESIGDLSSLRELRLSYCHCLQALPPAVCRLLSLEVLIVDTCMHITQLPNCLTQMSSLRELSLHNGEAWPVQLPALPSGIGHLPRLQKISMTTSHPPDDDSLPALPSTLAMCTSLEELQWGNLRLRRV